MDVANDARKSTPFTHAKAGRKFYVTLDSTQMLILATAQSYESTIQVDLQKEKKRKSSSTHLLLKYTFIIKHYKSKEIIKP